jgi:hypothetical protein
MPAPASLYNVEALQNVLVKRAQGAMAAGFILPPLVSAKQDGKIWTSDATLSHLIPRETMRAARAEANMYETVAPSSVTYSVIDHSLRGLISDEEREQAETPLAAEIMSVEAIQDQLMLSREVALVAALAAAITGGNTSTPAVKWGADGGNIFKDLKTKMTTIEDNVGVSPNALVIPAQVLRAASESAEWVSRASNMLTIAEQKRIPMATVLADALGIPPENIYVAGGFKNTGPIGGTASVSRIWGTNTLLFSKEDPSFQFNGLGLQIRWAGSAGSGGYEISAERAPASAKSDEICVHDYYVDKLINTTAAHWFTSTIA